LGVLDDVFCPKTKLLRFRKHFIEVISFYSHQKYIHIVGDESPKYVPEFVKKKDQRRKSKRRAQLQSYFIKESRNM
jgi:hypothetical protein